MKYHTKSLLLSIAIHLLLVTLLLFIYTNHKKISPTHQEKKVAICLNALKKEPIQKKKRVLIKKKKVLKKSVKKIKRKLKKKVHLHKKRVKKIIKKVPIPKITPHKKIDKAKEPQKILKPIVKRIETKSVKKAPIMRQSKKPVIKKNIVKKQESLKNIYIKNNLNKIVTLIHDNLYYPRKARKRGIEGVVVVRFYLKMDGSVESVKIISSQQNILSRAALKTIKELSGEFPKPIENLTITLPIHYQLD